MANVKQFAMTAFIKPNVGLLTFYILTFLCINIFAYDSYKIQFMLLNLILLHYLLHEFLKLSTNVSSLVFLQPYVLVIGLFYILGNLLPNLRFFFVDPVEVLPALMSFWSDDSYKPLIKPMYLLNLSAIAMFLGYKNQKMKSLGSSFRSFLSKSSTYNSNNSFKLSNFLVFFIITAGIISVFLQIKWGIFGYGVSDSQFAKYASYAQWFRYIDQLPVLLVVIIAYLLHHPKGGYDYLMVTMLLVIILLCAKGFVFASKGLVLFPILAALIGSYASSGKIFVRYLGLSVIMLIISFVVIEPYRVLKNVYPDATLVEAIVLLREVPDIIAKESIEEDVTLIDRYNEITIWFMGRNDNFSFSANAIEFKDKYGIPDNNNPDFLGSILYSPVLAYVPRFIWQSKPRDQIGAWYEDTIMQSPNYSASSFGVIGYCYFAGGILGVFLVFFFFGLMQRFIFETFLQMNSLPGVCAYLALILPVTMIASEIGGVITGFIRLIPVVILAIYLIFFDYKKFLNNIFSS
ncbi:hypothetical protein OAB98_04955 [Gammaproteobacteria bacterium]|nr:hypothetical protein [Gammaproteobacteria bacterium]